MHPWSAAAEEPPSARREQECACMRAWAFLVTSNDYYGRAAYPEWVYAAHFDANL